MVYFVGAGPGAEDLITVRGQKLIEESDIIIFAGSLVNPKLLTVAKNADIFDSSKMTLEEVLEVIFENRDKKIVRLHTGDPSLYGAIREQMDELDKKGICYEVCPGVSSFCGAAAALKTEYTLPGVTQSVIITRVSGRTDVPERESIKSFAAHGATMVVFLSTGLLKELTEGLLDGGYKKDTPAAIVYKATWDDEKIVLCTVDTLFESARNAGIRKTALIIIGNFLGDKYLRSKLYDPQFTTEFREAKT